MKPVYLDYSATTPVDPAVAETMAGCLTMDGIFANPASRSHLYGWQAEEVVERARRQVADLLSADPREIVWTSGATEANNLAIKGVAQARQELGRHIITSAIEHKAVLDPCAELAKSGFEVTCLKPDENGQITAEAVVEALRPDTVLVSVMHANNETGVINDIAAIAAALREHQALYHVDAAQTAGKLPLDLSVPGIDLLSCCAHKIYGPKGVGALFVRRQPGVVIAAQMHGGGHERGMRSGTLPTHQIAGMGHAFSLAAETMEAEQERLRVLRDRLWQGVRELGYVHINGHPEQRLSGVLNLRFEYVDGETLLMSLRDIAVSSGSACTSASVDPSYVLQEMGVPDALALSSLRISVGRFTTEADIDRAVACICSTVSRLREVSPSWRSRESRQAGSSE